MAGESVEVVIKAILDDASFQAGIKNMTKGFSDVSGNSDSFFGKLKNHFVDMVSGAALAVMAIAAITKAIIDSGKAYIEAEESETKLSNAMKANNQYTAEGFEEMKKFSEQLMFTTNTEKETAQHLLTLALNMGLTKDQAMQATQGAIGLNAALGIDMDRALRASSAALSGNTMLLQRTLPELKNFKTDAERVAFVLDRMKVGFQEAEENTKTFAGQLKFLSLVGHEVEETVGQGIAEGMKPALERLQEFLKTAEGMNAISGIAKGLAITFVVLETSIMVSLHPVIDFIKLLIDWVIQLVKITEDLVHKDWKKAWEDTKGIVTVTGEDIKKGIQHVKDDIADSIKGITDILNKSNPEIKDKLNFTKEAVENTEKDTKKIEQEYDKYLKYLKANMQAQIDAENIKYEEIKRIAIEQGKDVEAVEMQHQENIIKIQATYAKQYLSGAADMLSNIASLFAGHSKEQFEMQKAAAIANATIATYESAVKAYDSMVGIPVVGPGLGIAAAALAVTAGLGNIKEIVSQTYNPAKAARGGVFNQPSLTHIAEDGPEMVLPPKLTKMFTGMANMPNMAMSPTMAGGGVVNNNSRSSSSSQTNNIYATGFTINDFTKFSQRLGSNPFPR